MPDEESVSDPAAIENAKRIQDSIERMEIENDKALLTSNPAIDLAVGATDMPNSNWEFRSCLKIQIHERGGWI